MFSQGSKTRLRGRLNQTKTKAISGLLRDINRAPYPDYVMSPRAEYQGLPQRLT